MVRFTALPLAETNKGCVPIPAVNRRVKNSLRYLPRHPLKTGLGGVATCRHEPVREFHRVGYYKLVLVLFRFLFRGRDVFSP